MEKALRSVYQLKISLRGISPPIWRRVNVMNTVKLDVLHDIIQALMGWNGGHLHEYWIGRERYGALDDEFPTGALDEKGVRLDRFLKKEKDSLTYVYDFGDDWQHLLTLEKVLPYTVGTRMAECIAGKRACPPEDVGGIPGYDEFLQAFLDEKHPEHERMRDWVYPDFDPESFDLEQKNRVLFDI